MSQQVSSGFDGVFAKDQELNMFTLVDMSITARVNTVKVEHRTYDEGVGALIWGSTTRGIWGTGKWTSSATSPFGAWSPTYDTTGLTEVFTNEGISEITDWIAGDSGTGVEYVDFDSNGTNESTVVVNATSTDISSILTMSQGVGVTTDNVTFDNDNIGTVTYYSTDALGITKTNLQEVRVTIIVDYTWNTPLTNIGANAIMGFIGGSIVSLPSHIAFGNGSSTVAVTDTTMENELQRVTTTADKEYYNTANIDGVLPQSLPAGQPLTLNRYGLFDASSGGTMWASAFQFDITKTTNISLEVKMALRFL